MFVDKGCFSKLLEQSINAIDIIFRYKFLQILNYTQNAIWVKLRWVCSKYHTNLKIFEFLLHFFELILLNSQIKRTLQSAFSIDWCKFLKSRIFNTIKQNYLTLNVSNEAKEQINFFFFIFNSGVLIKERINNCFGVFSLFKANFG